MHDLNALLEENELEFLRRHRSATFDLPFGTLFVSSDDSVLPWNFVTHLNADETLESRTVAFMRDWKRTPCIKLNPASRPEGLGERLQRSAWTPRVRLSHMILERDLEPTANDIRVRACQTEDDIRTFSEVQSTAFGDPSWIGWVEKVNAINLRDSNQIFYVAEIDERPVGVCLLVSTGKVGGLYAVATLADSRKRGVARALMARARVDSRRKGNEVLCLNTAAGGPAETVFRDAGFRTIFESVFYTPGE